MTPTRAIRRAKKDTEVGGFYLKSGDYQGALLRYKDATTADPTNVEAIFGLAETQRMLKKNAEAARNYQLYLDIVPNGPKAKQALKALKTLGPRIARLIPEPKVVVPSVVRPFFRFSLLISVFYTSAKRFGRGTPLCTRSSNGLSARSRAKCAA